MRWWVVVVLGLWGLTLAACARPSSGAAPSLAFLPTPTVGSAVATPTRVVDAAARQAENQAKAATVRKVMTDAYAGRTEFPARFYTLQGVVVDGAAVDVHTNLPETTDGQAAARDLCRDFVTVVDDSAQAELGLEWVGVESVQGNLLAVRRVRGDEC